MADGFGGCYIARTSVEAGLGEVRNQPLIEHLNNVAKMAAGFSEVFGAREIAWLMGSCHDLGKYSREFQKRIRGENIRVDHSTAGARELAADGKNMLALLAAYCVAGHHAGLPDGGSKSQPEAGSLYYRLQNGSIPDYSAFRAEIPEGRIEPNEKLSPVWEPTKGHHGFSLAFLTRMLFSSLVDADRLDAEAFSAKGGVRGDGFDDIRMLWGRLEAHIERFNAPKGGINRKRTELLQSCLDAAKSDKGLFSLTAPTGSGKTIASMAFALKHALKHGLRRVIYVIPYCSIIEQNAKVFEDILGEGNVVQHHSGVDYDGEAEDENADSIETECETAFAGGGASQTAKAWKHPKGGGSTPLIAGRSTRKRFAVENWDAPVIVTTNVQFFESLFASKGSPCRKLHNIAGSVIVFDEAQMLPLPYLYPCVAAIRELVSNCNCTAVLATATQSALDEYFKPLEIQEINPEPKSMYEFFRRVDFILETEPLTTEQMAGRLREQRQALCIVNTRKRAQELVKMVPGSLHLSTTMYPLERSRVLDEVRRRLREGEECVVVSTSLVEAGVDVDFPKLFREKAGLDSVIQAAGRCNREGTQKREDAVVTVFEFEDAKPMAEIKRNIAAFEHTARKHEDIGGLDAIEDYFVQLRYFIGEEGLDVKKAVSAFDEGVPAGMSFPFKSVAEKFHLIEEISKTVVIDVPGSAVICNRLRRGERSKPLLREMQKYSVSLYPGDFRNLERSGYIERVDEAISILAGGFYDDRFGVSLTVETGDAIII
ncbi:MAG: CRISPR-associated endonuclease Cas3'' [Lachnospiraceae bacterium]|jgi:CRISPR-associated endonuclease/helicase Cas3|nr:CRISPR-associated endonuclease Cas3'' [Lachnospiraceae bacterium]